MPERRAIFSRRRRADASLRMFEDRLAALIPLWPYPLAARLAAIDLRPETRLRGVNHGDSELKIGDYQDLGEDFASLARVVLREIMGAGAAPETRA